MNHRFHGRSWLPTIAVVGLLGLVWSGCSKRSEMPTSPLSSQALGRDGASLAERVPEDKPGTHVEYCNPIMPFDPANFSNPLNIDNQWSPLTPGLQYVLTGQANRGAGLLPHRVIFTVTDMVKTINGVDCVVLWDRDYQEDILAEAELAFFAQDDYGNVWMMGEYPEEYDITSGEFQGAPSTWLAGVLGTVPGTLMLGDPEHGTGYYLQARAPSIRFLDCAKVFKTDQVDTVPVRAAPFEHILVTDERAPADWRGGHQRKYYAPGWGNIRVDFRGDPEGEILVMTELRHLPLDSPEMDQARAAVVELDCRAVCFSDIGDDWRALPRVRRIGSPEPPPCPPGLPCNLVAIQ